MDKREGSPKTDADEQGEDKVDTLPSSDVSEVDRENIHLEEVDDEANTSTMLNTQSNKSKIKIWMKGIAEKLMINLLRSTTAGAFASTDRVPYVSCPVRMRTLNGIFEALACDQNDMIGVLVETDSDGIADVLEKVSRRVKRDKLFDMVVMATVSHKPNNRKIQDEIAVPLGLKFDEYDEKKDVAKRAKRLRERILMEQKILVILCDICKGLDLDQIGIPFGTDHTGCRLLLTSASEEVLSNQMHVQTIFNV